MDRHLGLTFSLPKPNDGNNEGNVTHGSWFPDFIPFKLPMGEFHDCDIDQMVPATPSGHSPRCFRVVSSS